MISSSRLFNQTKNVLLADQLAIASCPFSRMKGLLGRKELPQGQGLLIQPCNSVHTFFMRFPIDVLFVDKNNKVIKAIPSLSPFRLTYIYFRAKYVIELPSGTIQATNTTSGDTLSF